MTLFGHLAWSLAIRRLASNIAGLPGVDESPRMILRMLHIRFSRLAVPRPAVQKSPYTGLPLVTDVLKEALDPSIRTKKIATSKIQE